MTTMSDMKIWMWSREESISSEMIKYVITMPGIQVIVSFDDQWSASAVDQAWEPGTVKLWKLLE
jgi:hypothetical protein